MSDTRRRHGCSDACEKKRLRVLHDFDVPRSGPDGWRHAPGTFCETAGGYQGGCSHWFTRHIGGLTECFNCAEERESES